MHVIKFINWVWKKKNFINWKQIEQNLIALNWLRSDHMHFSSNLGLVCLIDLTISSLTCVIWLMSVVGNILYWYGETKTRKLVPSDFILLELSSEYFHVSYTVYYIKKNFWNCSNLFIEISEPQCQYFKEIKWKRKHRHKIFNGHYTRSLDHYSKHRDLTIFFSLFYLRFGNKQ